MGQPVKVDDSLILDARVAGELESRSIAGQIEFWARLGAALEPLLQGVQVMTLLRTRSAASLSSLLESVDSAGGRARTRAVLDNTPFPHYEPAPDRRGFLVRIESDGTRTTGRFVMRRFVPLD